MTKLITVVALIASTTQPCFAVKPTSAELGMAADWAKSRLQGKVTDLPFSFRYGGQSSSDFLGQWKTETATKKIDDNRTERTHTYNSRSGLQVTCRAVQYHDFPAVEWTLHFKNTGTSNSQIIEEINPLDIQFARGSEGEFILHHNKGARATVDDFRPYKTHLNHRTQTELNSMGGRPTNGSMPYFNIQWPKRGAIVVMGWGGQWRANFRRDALSGLHITGGQPDTHFKLKPGEEARTPLVVVLQYEGMDHARSQNLWRRWMVKHSLPRPGGKLPPTQLVACSSHQFAEMIKANEENQKLFIDRYLEEKFPLSYWWMDAGWYKNDGTWINTGTWEVDPKRFPNGLRAITDHARSKGVKAIVWFEPERVTAGSWLYENHPEWLLSVPKNPGDQLFDAKWRLLNLGNSDALKWLTNHVAKTIEEQGINLYRQDFNLDPLHFWKQNDTEDRQGLSQIKHVTGYFAYWDALRKRFPDMLIDTCASGGRRLDLETLRRSVPLVRSDHLFEPMSQQSHTYGIAQWIPFHGTGTHIGRSAIGQHSTGATSSYAFRSHMACSVTACWDMRDRSLDYGQLRTLVAQMNEASPNFLGDYYPLTPYSDTNDTWIGWQYNRPEEGEGVVQVFRRTENPVSQRRFKLHGLDPKTDYIIDNVDVPGVYLRKGKQLMQRGINIHLPSPGSAAVIMVRKAV